MKSKFIKNIIKILSIVCIISFLPINMYAANEDIKSVDNANSWRYENGNPINDPYGISACADAYHPDATLTGIDVNKHTGEINWEKVKAAGIDFAIIRCGYAEDKTEYDDPYFEYNSLECERLGIPYGVYLYSYATSVEDASSEADHVLRLIEGKNLSFPVYYDLEDNSIQGADVATIAQTFCDKIEESGHPVGVYANLYWWNNYLTDSCFDNWHRWVAQWAESCTYTGEYAMWQYTSQGTVDGISENVDMNFAIGYAEDHNTTNYDSDAAVKFAQDNWDNDNLGVCDQFVKACLKAGNVNIEAGGVEPVMQALIDGKFGTFVKGIIIEDDGVYAKASKNPGVSKGDPLFVYCPLCDKYTHTMLITGEDDKGNITVHGRNPPQENYAWLGTYKHTVDGVEHTDCRLDAVHMTNNSFHNHTFDVNNYDDAHPHKMYAKCGCGTRYYLGWNATVKSCTECNPPLADKPVITSISFVEGKGIKLEWSTVSGATAYQVHRAKAAYGTYYKIGNPQTAVSFTNKSVESGVTYYYKIEAVLSDGTSVFSDIKSSKGETFTEKAPVAGPVLEGYTQYNGKPRITWTSVKDAVSYIVYRGETGVDGEFKGITTTENCFLINATAEFGKTNYYKVQAIFADESRSEFSNVIVLTVPAEEPVVLQGYIREDSTKYNGKPRITWNSVTGAKSYQVYRSLTGEAGTFFKISTTTNKSLTNTLTEAGKTYYYKVRAVYADDSKGEFSNVIVLTVPAEEPVVLQGYIREDSTKYNGKPRITWNSVTGAKSYQVYRSLTGEAGTFFRISTTTNKSLTNTSTEAGKTYYYKVRAVYADDSKGEFSNVIVLTVPAEETEEPVVLQGCIREDSTKYNGKPRITWNSVTGAKNYQVYRSLSGENGTFLKISTTTNKSLTNTSTEAGKTYYYKVRAVYADDSKGEFSNVIVLTVPAEETEEPVVLQGCIREDSTKYNGKPRITWNSVTGAKSYQVYRSLTGEAGTFFRISTTTNTSLTNTSTEAGKTYYYKVRAVYTDDSKGEFSNVVKLTT